MDTKSIRLTLIVAVVLACLAAPVLLSSAAAPKRSLTVYSGRKKTLVGPIIAQFEKDTGISVRVQYGGTSQLALAIIEEGDRSPADVFWAQDAGALGALAAKDRFAVLPDALLLRVPKQFRSPQGKWLATSGRARVLAYSPNRVPTKTLPDKVFDLTDAQ